MTISLNNLILLLTGDVFSGVGPIAIAAAKIVKRVYANDLNPQAVEYLEKNCVLNKLERKIKVGNNCIFTICSFASCFCLVIGVFTAD